MKALRRNAAHRVEMVTTAAIVHAAEREALVLLPVRVVSEANQREHWAAKYRRKRDQQTAVRRRFDTIPERFDHWTPPFEIKLTRLGGRSLDTDNLAGAFKHVRDELARVLGINDGNGLHATWSYAQSPGGPVGIAIEVRRRDA